MPGKSAQATRDNSRKITTVIFDLDGVIYRGTRVLPTAVSTVRWLQEQGYDIHFLTNNSTQTRTHYQNRLRRMGISCHASQIMTSAYATALYFQEKGLVPARVLVVGEPGLVKELRGVGLHVVQRLDEKPAQFVVVGMDQKFTYRKLADAQKCILAGARFIATNQDPTFPAEGQILPGSGSVVKAIETASGIRPFVIGKPKTYALRKILQQAQARPQQALVVGDRLDTDIKVGKKARLWTALVLTGVNKQRDLASLPARWQPHWVLKNLGGLKKIL